MKVDLDKIIKEKNPGLYRILPGFMIRLFGKFIHENEVNVVLKNGEGKEGVEFVTHTLDSFGIKRNIYFFDNIPKEGRYIFASNHPLGGLDGFVLLEAVYNRFGSVKIIVNDILMNLEPLKPVFLPINKHGRQSVEYVEHINDVLIGDTPVIYFPAGLCSRKIKGVIQDMEWKKSFVHNALKYNRDIVPVFVDSVNSKKFYNFALLRKKLNVKANLEMVLLPDELFKKRGSTIDVYIGDVIKHNSLLKSELSVRDWCSEIRGICYKMKRSDR